MDLRSGIINFCCFSNGSQYLTWDFLPSGELMFFEVVCQSPKILLVTSEAVILYLMIKLFSVCLPVKSHLAILLPVIQTLRSCAVLQSALGYYCPE